jgi:flagellar biosynthesis protein FliQ
MTPTMALELVRHAVMLTLLASAPLLAAALLIGVLISLVQAVTQIQEQTLSFIPKLVGMAAVLILTLPWMLRQLVEYLVQTLRLLPQLAG